MSNTEITAFGLAFIAGLSTLIGWAIVVFSGRSNRPGFMSLSMGFTAGVMIYLSFVELLGEAHEFLEAKYGSDGILYMILAFFGGLAVTALIDKAVPDEENPHELNMNEFKSKNVSMYRVGILTTLAVAVHNFPEGIATVFGSVHDISLGATIAIAIALHNIPEGIAISAPVMNSTGDKKKAFYWTLIAAIAEPIGAIVGYYALKDVLDDTIFALILAMIAGIMVFISFDQILPATEKYGRHHYTTYSIAVGMAIMAVTIYMTH